MSEQGADFKRGDLVQRKAGGVAGTVEEVWTTRSGRMKATVLWFGNVRYLSGRTDQRSHILCSSLVPARLASAEQVAELDRQARALGYAGYAASTHLTAERAEQRLADFAAGRIRPYRAQPVEPYAGLVFHPVRSRRGR